MTLALSLVLLAVSGTVTNRHVRVMKAHGGKGIVPFELAKDRAASKAILDAWGEAGRRAARRSLLWDLPVVAGYVLLAYAVTDVIADELRENAKGWATFATACGRAYFVAGALDLVENALLYVILRGDEREWPPRWASRAARAKFAIVLAFAPLVLTAAFAAVGVRR